MLSVILVVITMTLEVTHGITTNAHPAPNPEFLQCVLQRSELLEVSHSALLETERLKAEKKSLKEELVELSQARLDLSHDYVSLLRENLGVMDSLDRLSDQY